MHQNVKCVGRTAEALAIQLMVGSKVVLRGWLWRADLKKYGSAVSLESRGLALWGLPRLCYGFSDYHE